MDPITLPTDNLYKFLALSGLALAGFFTWMWWKLWNANRLQKLEVQRAKALKQAYAEAADIRDRVIEENLNKLFDDALVKHPDGDVLSHQEAAQLKKTLVGEAAEKLLKSEVFALPNAARSVDQLIQSALQESVLKEDEKALAVPMRLLQAGVVIGVLVAFGGFILWFIRLQFFLDRQTVDGAREQRAKTELAELQLERAKAKKPKR